MLMPRLPAISLSARSMTGSSSSITSISLSPSINATAFSSGKGKGVETFIRRGCPLSSKQSMSIAQLMP